MNSAERVMIESSAGGHLASTVTLPLGDPDAVVLVCPALGVRADYYTPFCQLIADMGVAVVVADLRGQGDSVPQAGRSTRHGYHVLASRDWPSLVAWTRERFGHEVPLFLLGHSIGGQISLHYSALAKNEVDGLVLVASGSVDYRVFNGLARLKVLLGTQFVAGVATLLGYWPGHLLGFAGRQPARLMRDWARIARSGRFCPEGSDVDYEGLLETSRGLPTLAISLAGDSLAPPAAVDRLCSKQSNSRVERWHYEPREGTKADHVRWVRDGAEIASYIRSWMDGNGASARPGH
ncbi:alpha/beta fold hydrolase [Streptomyces sp. NPDC056069]|uniref:alpha/beta hydrolase family protein n=1 Tax=Streptomyces sp. NPDC056069 TaxID=3345702 RepID=UPI0035D6BB3A